MIEFDKIHLVWRKGIGERRHSVGLLEKKSDGNHTFRYSPDTLKLQSEEGFTPYTERKRREENTLHWAFVMLVWIAAAGVGFVIVAKISHLVLPQFGWLDEVHLHKLDEFLTTGVIGGTIVGFFKGRLTNKES